MNVRTPPRANRSRRCDATRADAPRFGSRTSILILGGALVGGGAGLSGWQPAGTLLLAAGIASVGVYALLESADGMRQQMARRLDRLERIMLERRLDRHVSAQRHGPPQRALAPRRPATFDAASAEASVPSSTSRVH